MILIFRNIKLLSLRLTNQRLYKSMRKKENDLDPSEAQRVRNSVRYSVTILL